MAYVVFGERTAGRVEEFDNNYVESYFGHANGLIFGHTGSQLVLRTGQRIPIPRHRVSIRAAHLRLWPPMTGLCVIAVALMVPVGVGTVATLLIGAALVGVGILARGIGRVTGARAAQLTVYRAVTGYGVDPALLAYGNPTLEEHLREELGERAKRLAPDGYRDALSDWSTIATSGGSVDAPFLAIAMTLAAVESNRALVDAIWARLASLVPTLPPAITPLTRRSEDESAPVAASPPPPAAAPPREVVRLGEQRGSLFVDGYDVTIPKNAYAAPPICASCLAPAEHTRRSRGQLVPYCASCFAFASRATATSVGRRLIALCIGVPFAAIAFATGAMAATTSAAIGTAAALIATAIAALALPAPRAAGPATVSREAARVAALSGNSLTLFCHNAEWSQRLSEQFGGSRVARRRFDARQLTALPFALLAAPIVGFVAWSLGHPTLYIDNGTAHDVAVWVDGKVVTTLPPVRRTDGYPPHISVPFGQHSIGWSPAGAAGPTATASHDFRVGMDKYLLDPGPTHCYSVSATTYGDASVNKSATGPLAPKLIHDVSRVTVFFSAPPTEKRLKRGESSVEYAMTHEASCDVLAKRCKPGTVEKYWACIAGAGDEGDTDACEAIAAGCGEEPPADD